MSNPCRRAFIAVLAIALVASGAVVATGTAQAAPSSETTLSLPSAPPVPVELDRTGWSVTASSEGFGYPAAHLLDGNASTLWSTGSGQAPGQWLRVDLGAPATFDTVLLPPAGATGDYARAWSVTTSTDGSTWSPPVAGAGAGDGAIALGSAVTARYVRVEQTSGHFINAWSASEFRLTLTDLDTTPDFGPDVIIFDETTDPAVIQSTMDDLADEMRAAEFSTRRTAVLFKPGTYSVDSEVGYYTTVSGLGLLPGDVTVTGDIRVEGRVYNPAEFWVDDALVNFWRSIENLTIDPADGESRWAVSQASPMRRVHIAGDLQLSPQYFGYSSGGFIGDSKIDGLVTSGSQQQWFTRNSSIGSWSGSVWNQVFSGVPNAPTTTHPSPPITNVGATEVSREKPFLYVDENDEYRVFVPSLRTSTTGPSWESGSAAGTSLSIDEFHIAHPGDTAASINAQLASGKHLLLTPGVYELDAALEVDEADTIVLGMGVATLVPTGGNAAIEVADVSGVRLAGFMVDAGLVRSDALIVVGTTSGADHSANPTTVQDVYARIGGAVAGSATTSLEVNSDDVLIDHIWLWRADHGAGAAWSTNIGDHGLVVNGDDVSAYGLMVEHYQRNQVIWNGEGGRTVFYQSEIPYDPPTQAQWMDGTRKGYASYRVADSVTTHEAWGLGVYSYFNQGVDIQLQSAIQVPTTPGVVLNSMVSVFLAGSGSVIDTVNDQGTVVGVGTPMTSFVTRYPAAGSPACTTPGDRSTWTATASSSGFGYPTSQLFDGSEATLWTTGAGQQPGQWLLVDLGCVEDFEAIELAAGSATNDYARSWSVTLSSNGSSWSAPIVGTGSLVDGVQTLALGEQSARYIRIEQTSGHFINAWTASEFRLVEDDYSSFAPTVSSSASMVAPGELFTLSGTDFAPDEAITVQGPGALSWSTTASSSGALSLAISLPTSVARGDVGFTVTGALTEVVSIVQVLLRDAGTVTDPTPQTGCPTTPAVTSPVITAPAAGSTARTTVVRPFLPAVQEPSGAELAPLLPTPVPEQTGEAESPEAPATGDSESVAADDIAVGDTAPVGWIVGGAGVLLLAGALIAGGLFLARRRGI